MKDASVTKNAVVCDSFYGLTSAPFSSVHVQRASYLVLYIALLASVLFFDVFFTIFPSYEADVFWNTISEIG